MTKESPFALKGAKRGFGMDVSILDTVVWLTDAGEKKLDAFIAGKASAWQSDSNTYDKNSKNRMDAKQLQELEDFFQSLEHGDLRDIQGSDGTKHHGIRHYPGGSTGNAIYDMACVQKELGKQFNFDLVSVIGKVGDEPGDQARMIKQEYDKAGINVIEPAEVPQDRSVHAKSYIFIRHDGSKVTFTNPGIAKEKLQHKNLDIHTRQRIEQAVHDADFVFLTSTTMERFGRETFDFLKTLIAKHKKPLVYSLPTSAYRGRYSDNAHAMKTLREADVIVGNVEELINMFHKEIKFQLLPQLDYPYDPKEDTDREHPSNKQLEGIIKNSDESRRSVELTAIDCLRNYLRIQIGATHYPDKFPAVLITRGDEGSTVLDMKQISGKERAECKVETPRTIKNVNGAGDSAVGGFLFALINGLDPFSAGKVAAKFAAKKLEGGGPRISDANIKELADSFKLVMEDVRSVPQSNTQIKNLGLTTRSPINGFEVNLPL